MQATWVRSTPRSDLTSRPFVQVVLHHSAVTNKVTYLYHNEGSVLWVYYIVYYMVALFAKYYVKVRQLNNTESINLQDS